MNGEPMIGSILLAAALSFSGVRVIENRQACSYEPELMGEYVLDSRTISICNTNVIEKGYTREHALKHETIHAIHHNLGWEKETFIRDPLLTWMVRSFMSDVEVLGVLFNYPGETDQEFDARLLAYLPSDFIALLLVITS